MFKCSVCGHHEQEHDCTVILRERVKNLEEELAKANLSLKVAYDPEQKKVKRQELELLETGFHKFRERAEKAERELAGPNVLDENARLRERVESLEPALRLLRERVKELEALVDVYSEGEPEKGRIETFFREHLERAEKAERELAGLKANFDEKVKPVIAAGIDLACKHERFRIADALEVKARAWKGLITLKGLLDFIKRLRSGEGL